METKKSTFALFFYINRKRIDKEKRCPIYLRISVNNTQAAVSIKRSILPEKWNSKGFPDAKGQEVKELNAYFSAIRAKLFKIQEDLMLKEEHITADMFKAALFGTGKDNTATILTLYQEIIEREKALYLQKKKSRMPYTMFQNSAKFLKQFMQKQYKVDDISFKKIDCQFIDRFIDFLNLSPNIGHNYRVTLLAKLKNVLKTAVRYRIIETNPFSDEINLALKIDGDRNYLNEEQTEKFICTPLDNKAMKKEQHYFSFGIFTGLSHIDIIQLEREQLHKIDERWWICVNREKTEVLSLVPLLPQAEAIIRKYCPNFEEVPGNTRIFPFITNRNRNIQLKKIAVLCKIDKNLTTHVARHTFATTITLTNDVPLETVSKMLGHKSLRMTQHYAKVVNKKILSDMEKLRNVLPATYQIAMV